MLGRDGGNGVHETCEFPASCRQLSAVGELKPFADLPRILADFVERRRNVLERIFLFCLGVWVLSFIYSCQGMNMGQTKNAVMLLPRH